MLLPLVKDKVYYKIFDKSYKNSSHIYAKAHLAEDELVKAEANIMGVKKDMGLDDLLILNQVHGTDVVDADTEEDLTLQLEADACLTTKRGIGLAIQTADCVPLLLACQNGTVIGAAHCGWKGTKEGIVDKITSQMVNKGARGIKAFIGPAIAQKSYEVDESYYQNFITENSEFALFFEESSSRPGHYLFDLPGIIIYYLKKAGIKDILNINHDTYSLPEKYQSYRRDCHLGNNPNKERILSVIVIK